MAHRPPARIDGCRAVIACERYHAVLPVADIAASIDFYTSKLGFSLDFTQGEPATFAAISFGENAQLFLITATTGTGKSGLYFVVSDANAMLARCSAAGARIVEPIGDRQYELRDFSIEDVDGYILTFGHRL
jgi:catechol 2,3-dioxygenase-like lactoylglutathione lyase family enzyme